MLALQLSEEAELSRNKTLAFEVAMLCERRGLHITFSYYEPVIRFIPPLIISRVEIDEAIDVLEDVFRIVENKPQKLTQIGPQNGRSGPFVTRMNGRMSTARMIRKMWSTSPQEWFNKLRAIL
jgi:hypothetical protein